MTPAELETKQAAWLRLEEASSLAAPLPRAQGGRWASRLRLHPP